MLKRKILIVDDNVTLSRLLRQQLEALHEFSVRVENQPAMALALMRTFQPDLVILDVMMPEVDGGMVAAQMKVDLDLAETPVIFLTGSVRKEEVEDKQGLIGGMTFLAKPVDFDQLLDCIDRLVPARRSG
jgi:CheY-like chemotaxis protein